MCGIAGQVGTRILSTDRLRTMRDRLTHRGPDSAGEHSATDVFIGVRRLRVIDLVTGDQPMYNEDRTIAAVLNGEIYNYRELRAELAAGGHGFRTGSDAEVLVHAYEDAREDLVKRLEGMFAFALWDSRERKLVLARDRLGKKPLLYAEPRPGTLAFASEFVALLEDPDVARELDPRALDAYLSLGYIPAPLSIYRGIRKLLPGHVGVWQRGTFRSWPYWSVPAHGSARIGLEEAEREVLDRVRRAVRARLVADVPLGAFLSGGVDSSLVVALMAEEAGRVRTFSIGFDERDYSELIYARRIASRYATEHHELVVRPDLLAVAPVLARHYGEPYGDSSAVPMYYLSRMAREHVTVALSGDGGDEAFAGYDRYRGMRLAGALDVVPRGVRAPLSRLGSRVLRPLAARRGTAQRARRFIEAAAFPVPERYLRIVSVFTEDQKDELLRSELRRSRDEIVCLERTAMGDAGDPAERANASDLKLYLPDDLLVKTDIASMANSLEVRSPLLDREVVELGVSLPLDLKLRGREGKHVLKRAAAALVPAANLHRPKMGFGVPIGEWFREGLVSLLADTILSSGARSRTYFRPLAVEALVEEHRRGRADHTHRLWALLMFELWQREFGA